MPFRIFLSAILFTLVAVASFSCWAFGGRLFHSELTLYTACAVVFLGLGGVALSPGLPPGKGGIVRFSVVFAVSFLAYAFLWSTAWFLLPNTLGEVVGSTLGLIALVAIMKKALALDIALLSGVAIVFLMHTLGYYLGGFAYEALQGRGPYALNLEAPLPTVRTLARLSWGIGYGLGLGCRILALFHASACREARPSTQICDQDSN